MKKSTLSVPIILCGIFFALALSYSCKKKEDPKPDPIVLPHDTITPPDNQLADCDLKYIVYPSGNYEYKFVFSDDDPRKLHSIRYLNDVGETKKGWTLSYDPVKTNQVNALFEYHNNSFIASYVDSFYYDDKGVLSTEVQCNVLPDTTLAQVQYIQFYHDDSGNVTSSESYSISTSLLQGSTEYKYDTTGQVIKITYYDQNHTEQGSEEYQRTGIVYTHFDIFENLIHRNAWRLAPNKITLKYGASTTVTNFILKANEENYLIHADVTGFVLGQLDTIPDTDYEYQCFH